MKYIADKLEELDHYFENKSEPEKWIMISLLAGAVALMMYVYLFPIAKEMYDRSLLEQKTITKKINEEKTYLQSISRNGDRDYKVRQLKSQISNKKNQIVKEENKIEVINSNLNKLSDMLFNQKSWANFLYSITHRAAENSVVIESISNHNVDSNSSFGHVLEIGVQCAGDFKNIIKFMNDLEQNALVTDIFSSRIYVDINRSIILSDINISVWGVNH